MGKKDLQAWIGRQEVAVEAVTARHVSLMSSVLESQQGERLSQCGHWIIAVPLVPLTELGPDGHIKLGRFLPPVALPRRMWAGSRMTFHRPLSVDDVVSRTSIVRSVTEKTGSAGGLVFVEVEHSYSTQENVLLVSENQSIVYREGHAAPKQPETVESTAPGFEMQRTVAPDEVMLFRYSAMTFNSHRIHYDRSYAREVEGYPGLVVHGPLIATLLADLVARYHGPGPLESFSFRGQSPAFAGEVLHLAGRAQDRNVTLRAWGPDGRIVMKAEGRLWR